MHQKDEPLTVLDEVCSLVPDKKKQNYRQAISLRSFQGGIETSDYRGVVSPAYTVLKPKVAIDDNFYRHYFKSIRFIRQLGVAIVGIRDGKQISFEDFSAIRIPKPELDEQRKLFPRFSMRRCGRFGNTKPNSMRYGNRSGD